MSLGYNSNIQSETIDVKDFILCDLCRKANARDCILCIIVYHTRDSLDVHTRVP